MVRAKGTVTNTIRQGQIEGKRLQRRPPRQWLDDVKESTGLILNKMWKGPEEVCGLEKVCQSCCPNGLNNR